ncbi:MAG: enoyl-CoA hydratase-related protein [Bacteroidetes bacterium]|nr:enoyl-CoA hydratase-related protein [Bacteroidota bacterium]MCL5738076.1 enoyl-CoA hydratase-related protein [Bacteroidota bacterium]
MDFQTIKYGKENHAAIITINRPDKLNALNATVIKELGSALNLAETDKDVAAVIITGAGEKAFVAGADISELNKLDVITAKDFAERGQMLFNNIEKFKKPVIAAVNGYALGGGSELAWACHIRIASTNAKFGQPEVNLGIIPGYGGTQRLVRLVGRGIATELIITGNQIDAETALRFRLVNKVVEQAQLLSTALQLVESIAERGPFAIRLALQAIDAAVQLPQDEGMKLEAQLFALCCGTADQKEGTSAFLEKRKPVWKGA